MTLYLIDRPEPDSSRLLYRCEYRATGFDMGVYSNAYYTYTLGLSAFRNEETLTWSVNVKGCHGANVCTVILPDYQPGAVSRGVVTLR